MPTALCAVRLNMRIALVNSMSSRLGFRAKHSFSADIKSAQGNSPISSDQPRQPRSAEKFKMRISSTVNRTENAGEAG